MQLSPALSGDLFLTRHHTALFGVNAAGRVEVSPVFNALQDRYPAFVSEFHKRGRAGRLEAGTYWLWRDSRPWLLALIVRETPSGSTRLRHVDAALLALVKDGPFEGLHSLAVLRLSDGPEWADMRDLLVRRLDQLGHPALLYDDFRIGVRAEPEPASDDQPTPEGDPARE